MCFSSLHRMRFWLLAAGVVLSAAPALAQSPADFYRGKTMIVSSASGGGYDTLPC